MGRDRIHGECITRLIEILGHARENGITYLKDGGFNGRDGISIYGGISAMCEFVIPRHPTGEIYRAELFREIPGRTRYFEISDMFPDNYVKHDLLLAGKGAYIRSGVYVLGEKTLVDLSVVKSGVEGGGSIFDAYYAPRRSALQRFEIIDLIDGDCPGIFTRNETDRYLRVILDDMLRVVSDLWHHLCGNLEWLAHYGHQPRHVSLLEMSGNILRACKSTQSHLAEKGTLTASRRAIILLCAVKALMKYTVYHPMRRAAKRVLKSVGLLH